MCLLKTNILKAVAFILSLVAVVSVNSSCSLMFGQPEEPNSLQRFKKV